MEQSLRIFENRMLRKIFGLDRDEINREKRRFQSEEIYYFTLHQLSFG
jgi:hypothetical protein